MENKETKKLGRPRTDSPKLMEIRAAVSKELNDEVLAWCKKHRRTRSEMIRIAVEELIEKDK